MLAHARAQGTVTAVTTNATLLSRAFAEKLVDAGLGLLTVSLHGASKAVAEKIMRGADFDRVIANIETLQQVKDQRGSDRPLVQINCVGQRDNVHELPALIGLAARLGIRIIQFVHLLVSADIDPKNSLVHHPQALTDSVRRAQTLAAQLGVTLHISPTYIAVIEEFERAGAAAVHAPPAAGCA
jgi:MoaA/NifB/PqqE/SkfB family radical SAM enzyme